MARIWDHRILACLLVTLVCCLRTVVDSDPQLANNYKNLVVNLRGQVSHTYRNETRIMTGGRGNTFLPLASLAGGPTSVELIISHRDLYVLGYRRVVARVGKLNERIVYIFKDTNKEDIDESAYNRLEPLGYKGSYTDLERYARRTRVKLSVTPKSLREGIKVLDQEPKKDTEQQAQILLALVMIVSEGARFTDVCNTVSNSLGRSGNDAIWRATVRQEGIMNSWGTLSQFILDGVKDMAKTSTKYFPKFKETLTLGQALDLCAIIKRPRT